jgi:hypothetical protein
MHGLRPRPPVDVLPGTIFSCQLECKTNRVTPPTLTSFQDVRTFCAGVENLSIKGRPVRTHRPASHFPGLVRHCGSLSIRGLSHQLSPARNPKSDTRGAEAAGNHHIRNSPIGSIVQPRRAKGSVPLEVSPTQVIQCLDREGEHGKISVNP